MLQKNSQPTMDVVKENKECWTEILAHPCLSILFLTTGYEFVSFLPLMKHTRAVFTAFAHNPKAMEFKFLLITHDQI